MKKSLLLAFLPVALLTMSAFADEITVKCSKDLRMVDGPLVTYSLMKNSEKNAFSLVEESSAYDLTTGKETKNRSVLEYGLTCSFAENPEFQCSVDLRSFDGPHKIFTLSKEAESEKYSLTRYFSFFDLRARQEIGSTTTLSDGLSCK
jgi:hypothetical protein